MFQLTWTNAAQTVFVGLRQDHAQEKRFKAVRKALRFLAENPRHPSLGTHEWKSTPCPHGDKLWEAYAENRTAGAYRIFFCYPSNQPGTIHIVSITPHP